MAMKLIKRVPANSRFINYRMLLDHDSFDNHFEVTDTGYQCPVCLSRVLYVKHPLKPKLRGLYCDCTCWVGHKKRTPSSEQEWQHVVEHLLQ
jgi:hypothetical protein